MCDYNMYNTTQKIKLRCNFVYIKKHITTNIIKNLDKPPTKYNELITLGIV